MDNRHEKIAHWLSRSAKWEAVLFRDATGYRLSERKHGREVAASFRPFDLLPTEEAAMLYFAEQVREGYDVKMELCRHPLCLYQVP